MMHYGYFFGPLGVLGAVLMILWWALIIVAIISLIRFLRGDKHQRWRRFGGDSAMELLRERFAQGEIDKAEFEERKRELEKE
jgi:putative membrane protein